MDWIRTEDLCKVYGSGENAVYALNDVNITIERGEFVAICGASGSGKSTLLNLLGAVDKPTSGRVIIDGADLTRKSEEQLATFRRRRIGFVFQFFNLIPVLNVEENIAVPMMLDGKQPDKRDMDTVLKLVGLSDKRDRLPAQLSGGQQQRVAIARALIHRPALILADEPTGNLDSRTSREIVALLRRSVNESGQTLVLITHDPQVAAQADRVIHIKDGRTERKEPSGHSLAERISGSGNGFTEGAAAKDDGWAQATIDDNVPVKRTRGNASDKDATRVYRPTHSVRPFPARSGDTDQEERD